MQEQQEELSVVIECLKKGLLRYKESRPALSWRAISKQSGVNRYFINKIIEDEPNLGKLSIDIRQVLLLSKFLSKKKSMKASTDAQETPLKEAIKNTMKVIYSSSHGREEFEMMDQADAINFESFCILVLAHDHRGVPKNDIIEMLGAPSIDTIDYLVERKKIKINSDNKVTLTRKVFMDVTTDIRNWQIQNFISRFVKRTNHGKERQYSHLYVSRLNSKGLEKVIQANENFHEIIAKIMNNEELSGEIPVFSSSCSSIMLNK